MGHILIVFTNLTQAQLSLSKWQNANVSITQCGLHCVQTRSNVTGLEYIANLNSNAMLSQVAAVSSENTPCEHAANIVVTKCEHGIVET